MSRKQIFSRLVGRKKDANSTSPYPQNDYNGINNNTNNYNGSNGQYHNSGQNQNQNPNQPNHYTSPTHNSVPNSATTNNNNNNNTNNNNQNQRHHNHQTQNPNSNTNHSSGHHSSHKSSKSRSKHSNGKRRKGHTERMTIETSALSTEMSQQDVTKLLKLDNIPQYRSDDRGYIEFARGLFIDQRYILLETLGRGTFSKVFESIDVLDKTKVAVKVIRNSHRYIEAAKTELRVLQHITNADDGRSCCIHLKDSFHWNKHPCLAFKLYGPSIYTVMAKNHYRPFPDPIVKDLTLQICTAIQFMHHLGIIFTDLKPENMVFVDGRTQAVMNKHGKQEFLPVDSRIKLVDFGSAVYEPIYNPNNPKTFKFKDGYNYLIQTRHYRAPEVVLEMPWKRQVDVWSIGCVILEFLYGSMVFNTHCAIDHLNQMQKMIGKIPNKLIQLSSDKAYEELFLTDGSLNLANAKISRAQAKPLRAYFNFDSIEHQALYDLVQRTLRWEAKDRISADNILRHAYFQINSNDINPNNNDPTNTNANANATATAAVHPSQNGYHTQQQPQQHSSHSHNRKNPNQNGYVSQQQQQPQHQYAPNQQQMASAAQIQAQAQAQAQAMQQAQYLYTQQRMASMQQSQQAQQIAAQQRAAAQAAAAQVPAQQYVNNSNNSNNNNNNNNSSNGNQQPYITQ